MTEPYTDSAPFRITEQSFRDIYLMYWEKVYAVCYNTVRDPEPCKGMVQEIFKSLWERRDALEITTSVERYLMRSAKFKVFEYIRNNKSRKEHNALAMAEYCGHTHCTEHEVMYNSLKDKVDDLVDTLPCQCRRVFRMSREQGLTNKEIAASLLISERAVEYHISRALTTLRTHLADYMHPI